MKKGNRSFLVFDLFGAASRSVKWMIGVVAYALAVLCTLFFLALGSLAARAADLCPSADVFSMKLITKICWDCMYPIRVSGVTISGKKNKGNVPDEAANQAFCMCNDGLGVPHPGILTQFWEPYRMVEWQRIPGCMSVLNGARFPFRSTFVGQHGQLAEDGKEGAMFKHYHYFSFPVMEMMEMFIPADCNPGYYSDIDIIYLSEMDPTWNDDVLAYFSMPENSLLTSTLAAVACLPEAVSATFAEKPIQSLFWCAGTWGLLYPSSGNAKESDPINGTMLFASRMLNVMHRRGFVHRTVGEDAMCAGVIDPTLPKYQYRFSMFHPIPHTDDTFVIGESPLRWGLTRIIPATGEDQVYIIWRWLDCCMTKSEGGMPE